MNNVMTDRDLIERLGGYVKVASRLGLMPRAVHKWTRPGRGIPGRYWPEIIRLALSKGIAADDLAAMHRQESETAA